MSAPPADAEALARPLAELIDSGLDAAADEAAFSGVIRLDLPGDQVVVRAYGWADRSSGVAMTPETRLAIASGTKVFTALTVMALVERRQLALDTTARALLGDDLALVDDRVTVGHLLAHRSGIGDYLDEDEVGDIADYVMPRPLHTYGSVEAYLTTLDGHPQVSEPGHTFAYNNGGFVLLALLAERATGRPYATLVDELVCRPAGLTHTGFERADALPPGVAVGYLEATGHRTNSLHIPLVGGGDGGLVSAVDDIAALWRALFGGRIVSDAAVRQMTSPSGEVLEGQARYGLGFWLHPTGPAIRVEGYDAGISFRTWFDPDAGAITTVIGNWSDAAWPVLDAISAVLGPA